ncbi:MerR family transcriptional regulator [Lagierella sp.]|uniref:MerR family transcriptional regulator n=1 Tax=Lagierella sp. TaxID=2849657 RepID=UPI0026352A49|nr:MerR family transcriptional regulator [Lagierella sp.]
MNIKEVSEILGVLPSKIRYYEDQGLIEIPRDENGYRNFDEVSLEKLKIIISLKNLEFSLKDIRYAMELLSLPPGEDCNKKSRGYWEELIYEVECELKSKLKILETLREVYDLSTDHISYEKNKDKIVEILGDNKEKGSDL